MRPQASIFLPGGSSPTTNGSHQAAAYSSSEDDFPFIRSSFSAYVPDDTKDKPQDLILHEPVKKLLEEISKLGARCDSLETANAKLKESLQKRETTNTKVAACPATPTASINITGYDSSDDGSPTAEPDWASKLSDLEHQVYKVILPAMFHNKSHIETQSGVQNEMSKHLERQSRDHTSLKGRVGTVEHKLKDVNEILDDNALSKADQKPKHGTTKGPSTPPDVQLYFQSEIFDLQERATLHESNTKSIFKELKDKVDTLTAVVESMDIPVANPTPAATPPHIRTTTTRAISVSLERDLKGDIDVLKAKHKEISAMLQYQRIIDDASSRDDLYKMFRDLTTIMGKPYYGGPYPVGDFTIHQADAFTLRDRVICRLVLMGGYDAALKAAQAAKVTV